MSQISTEERTIDGLTFTIAKYSDNSPDLSWIGEYTNEASDFIIDREKGILWGQTEGEDPDPYDFDDAEGHYNEDAYEKAEKAWLETGVWARDLHRMGRRELMYFKPYAGGIDPKKNKEEWIKYALQDYNRMEAYNRGEWCMMGIEVSLYMPDCPTCGQTVEISDSLWGTESDSRFEYHESVIADLVFECKAQAGIEKVYEKTQ